MSIKFCVIKALDGRFNYGPEALRDLLGMEEVGTFPTIESATAELADCIQRAFDNGGPNNRKLRERL